MKELEILKALEDDSVAGAGNSNDPIKTLVIELLCENHNYDLNNFIQIYDQYITNPLKNYEWRGEKEWYKDRFNLVELGFYKLKERLV